MEDNPVLTAARAKREKQQAKMDAILVKPTEEARALSDEEAGEFEELAAKIVKLDDQIRLLETEEARKAEAARAAAALAEATGDAGTPTVTIKREPMTYEEFGQNSYMRDMGLIAWSMKDPGYATAGEAALERMRQHGKEVEVEARHNKAVARELRYAKAETRNRANRTEYEERVTPSTAAGFGGELVPPVWYIDGYAKFLRPGRIFADRVSHQPLPPGTDSLNWPKITLGALTGIQTANNAAVASRDFTTTSISAAVNTIAGQSDVSLQLIEQSPLGSGIDGLLQDDLNRDYDQQLDTQVVAGTGTNGQHLGILNVTSASSPSVTQASAVTVSSAVFWDGSTSGTQYRSIVKGVNQIETLTFMALPPTGIWVHPRRANSWAYAADSSTGRPLFTPNRYSPYNVVGLNESSPVPEGLAGDLYGLPVLKDGNMPTTMNGTATTGGTADPIVILNESVPVLFEGAKRFRALPEILSGTLAVRFQLYGYSAFMPTRFPQAIAILTGNTGLASPGF